MNGVDMGQLIQALTEIAAVLNGLGLPGLIGLSLCGPAAVLCAILFIDYQRSRRMQDLVELMRAESRSILEAYRADYQEALRELGANQERTDRYYRDNVELAKRCEAIARSLQDVVVSSTRAAERLATMIEARKGL